MSEPKRYQQQIDVAFQIARQRVEQAGRMSWPQASATLARAVEHGILGVLIAWGAPRKNEPAKIRTAYDELIRPQLGEPLVAALDVIWPAEKSTSAPPGSEAIAGVASWLIDQLHTLAEAPWPEGWTPQQQPDPLTWEALDEDTRALLLVARDTSAARMPGVQLFLTGSRAAGRGRPDSDYDVLMIFPTLADPQVNQAIGSVRTCVPGRDIDVIEFDEATWEQPDSSYEMQVDLCKQCCIAVPGTAQGAGK